MTKDELAEKLRQSEETLRALQQEHFRMLSAQKTEWEQSDVYKETMARVAEADRQAEHYRKRAERAEAEAEAIKNEAIIIYQDNQKLSQALGQEYHIGSTFTSDTSDGLRLKKEIIQLQAQNEAKERTIQYLRHRLAGEDTTIEELAPRQKRGPKAKISDEVKERVIEMYRYGATFRTIAQAEGISIGSVAGIVKKR